MPNVIVLGSFLAEVGHLFLDHPRVDAVLPWRQASLGDVFDHRGVEDGQAKSRRGPHERSGFAKHPRRVDETQAPRIDARRKSRFVTQETDGVVGRQDAVDLLPDARGVRL